MTYSHYPEHPENTPGDYSQEQHQPNTGTVTQGTGTLNIIDAIVYGFKATFNNAAIWLLGALVVVALMMGISLVTTIAQMSAATGPYGVESSANTEIPNYITQIISGLVAIFAFNGALIQMDKGTFTVGEAIHNPKIGLAIGVWVLVTAATFVLILTGVIDSSNLWGSVVVIIVSTFIAPFIQFLYLYILDGQGSLGECLQRGFRAGGRNYLRILGFNILLGVIIFLAALPCGLGLIVVFPAAILAQSHAYRQISSGHVRNL